MKKNDGGYLSIILTMSMSLLIIHFITKWSWPVIASLVIGMIAILVPRAGSNIALGWKKITMLIGFILQRVVLILIFYIFLVPIAFASRLFRKRKSIQLSDEPSSTFIELNKSFDKREFEKPW
jgi:predicted membrane protein